MARRGGRGGRRTGPRSLYGFSREEMRRYAESFRDKKEREARAAGSPRTYSLRELTVTKPNEYHKWLRGLRKDQRRKSEATRVRALYELGDPDDMGIDEQTAEGYEEEEA